MNKLPEVWLRGPLNDVPLLLQPVAQALLQSGEEINEYLKDFDASLIWEKPEGLASVAFHLYHIAGVQDRLFTYARNEMLNEIQLEYLQNEDKEKAGIQIKDLLENLNKQIEKSIQQLRITDVNTLTETRFVGRKKVPSTVIGLLVHTAEHTMRHTGQLLVTIKFLQHLRAAHL